MGDVGTVAEPLKNPEAAMDSKEAETQNSGKENRGEPLTPGQGG